jgi:hypothetical protein
VTDKRWSIGIGTLVVFGIFLLALAVRVSNLGATPLSDGEAREALWAAAGTTSGSPFWPILGARPASSGVYQAVTWMLFDAFGGTEATARALPAVLGALMVLPPWWLRRRLGEVAALVVAFLLAISPVLIAGSRTAGGDSASLSGLWFAVTVLILALDGELSRSKAIPFLGLSLALGLAGGSLFYLGLIGLVLALAVWRWLGPGAWESARVREVARQLAPGALAVGVGGAFLVSVAAGFLPRGATALAEGVRAALAGWFPPGDMPSLNPVAILVSYEPLILVFGVIGAVSAWRRRESLMVAAALWSAMSLVLIIAYPGRDGPAVALCLTPLAYLAGKALVTEAENLLRLPSVWAALAVGGVVLLLFLYAGLQLAAYAGGIGPGVAPLDPNLRLGIALGALAVAGLVVLLVGLGWNWKLARAGAGVALGAVLLLGTIASGSWLNSTRIEQGAHELWAPSAPTYGLQRLRSTLLSLSTSSTGIVDELPVALDGIAPPPSLVWAIRSFQRFSTSDSSRPESPPLLLLPDNAQTPAFASDFLGQKIPIEEHWATPSALPANPVTWWWRRNLATDTTTWILLVRSDVATQGESNVQPSSP